VSAFRVLQIDHVELFVPDRHEAAGWYRHVLGLEIVPEYEHWAAEPRGPLMISSDGGSTKLALFQGRPGLDAASGFHLTAFRVDASGFMAFLDRLTHMHLRDHRDRVLTADLAVDHDQAFSIYFCDPYGHRLEVTTYDHDAVRQALRAR
jgi:catechol 2,3-dioxygenase-like lactoylglutathione lyase family enzyme